VQAVVDVSEDGVDLGRRSRGAGFGALQVETRGVEVLGPHERQRELRLDQAVSLVEREGFAQQLDGAACLPFGETLPAQLRQAVRDLPRGGRAGRDFLSAPVELGDRAVAIGRVLSRQSQRGEQRGLRDQETVNGADAWRAWPVAAS
jgi:hypothetical protein